MDEITIMVVTFGRFPLTKRFYKSLLETTTVPFNLIFIDNGSVQDGTVEWLKELKPEASVKKLIVKCNNTNRGIAKARNQGLKLADELGTQYFVCADNDVEMPRIENSCWLQECISIMKANPMYNVGVNFEDRQYPLVTKNGFEFQEIPGNLGTAGAVFSKMLFKTIGYFKTDYPSEKYASEDADYGARGRAAAYRFSYLKEPGIHFGGENEEPNYRKWKDECHAKNLQQFRQNCALYYQHKLPIYLPYKD